MCSSDLDRTTERARQLGASVLLEPREGPVGWRSVVRTCEGGEIAFQRGPMEGLE